MSDRMIADGWLNAFINKDVSRLVLADDFVHASPFGKVHGREAYLGMVRANEEAFFSQPIEIQDVFDCGDKFVYRYMVGDMEACDCIYITNDEITEIFSYYHFGEKPVM